MDERTASEQIDDIIKNADDWRGAMLSELRGVITGVSANITEEVKWKKPSKPEGVSVWSYDGNLCIGEMLKGAVRLTFPNGAQLPDAHKLFNTRLDGNTVRAIDLHEGDAVQKDALQALVREAAAFNTAKAH